MKKLPKGKLYHGSDSLLSIVIGAINNDGYASNYSRVGLGPKGTIKPDVASYGGELLLGDNREMIMKGVKSFSRNGNIASSSGTSFATARISSLATIIYQNICIFLIGSRITHIFYFYFKQVIISISRIFIFR